MRYGFMCDTVRLELFGSLCLVSRVLVLVVACVVLLVPPDVVV